MTEPATKKPREEGAADGEKDVIMVTGGSGLVGQAIRMYVESNKKDNEEWIYLSSKDGDLRVRADTDAIFAKYKPTHVIHLAAKVGGLFANMAQKVCRQDSVCEVPAVCRERGESLCQSPANTYVEKTRFVPIFNESLYIMCQDGFPAISTRYYRPHRLIGHM